MALAAIAIQLDNSLLRPALSTFVVNLSQSTLTAPHKFRPHIPTAGPAKRCFGKTAKLIYEICKTLLIFVGGSEPEPSSFIVLIKFTFSLRPRRRGALPRFECFFVAVPCISIDSFEHGCDPRSAHREIVPYRSIIKDRINWVLM